MLIGPIKRFNCPYLKEKIPLQKPRDCTQKHLCSRITIEKQIENSTLKASVGNVLYL